MSRRVALFALLFALSALAFGGCRFGGASRLVVPPIAGDVPETIAIWPKAIGGEPAEASFWFAGLDRALTDRGFRCIAPGVVKEILREHPTRPDPIELGRVLRADALMELHVHRFETQGRRWLERASWSLEWRLVSTRGQGVQWQFTHTGNWSNRPPDPAPGSLDPHHDTPPVTPLGQSPLHFRTREDLLTWLHHQAVPNPVQTTTSPGNIPD